MANKEKLKSLLDQLTALQDKDVLPDEIDTLIGELVEESTKLKENPTIKILQRFSEEIKKFKMGFDLKPIIQSIKELQTEIKNNDKLVAEEFKRKLQEIKATIPKLPEIPAPFDSSGLVKEISDLRKQFLAQKDFDPKPLQKELDKSRAEFVALFNQDNVDDTEQKKELEEKIDKLRKELINRISNLGGGSMNRQIKIAGVDVLTKYTDINLVAGSNITLTSANDNTDKNVDITIAGTGIGGTITGATAGSVFFAGALGVLAQDNANFFWDDTNNRLGIGTAGPGTQLHQYSATAAVAHRIENANATPQQVYTDYKTTDGQFYIGKEGNTVGQLLTGDTAHAGILNMITNDPMQFGTNDTVRMTILGDGNVGIGTTNPGYLLHLETTGTTLTNNLKVNAAAASGNYGEIAFQTWSGAGSGLNTFGGAGTSRPSVVLRGLSEDASARGAFVVATFSGGADNTNLTEKFRITSDGNVGIGVTPTSKFNVFVSAGGGSAGDATFDPIVLERGGTSYFNIITGTANEGGILFSDSVRARGVIAYAHATDALYFSTAETERWRITSAGHFIAGADNLYDIGASAATRPRNLFLGGYIEVAGNVTSSGSVAAGAAGYFYWTGRSVLASPSDGVIKISNNAETDFNRLQFGGTTSAFPSLKRSTTDIHFRLADDSADTSIQVAKSVQAPSANNRMTSNRILYGATTDAATAVELTTNGAAGSGATNRIAVPTDTALSVVLNVCVKQSASASAKQMLRQFVISNNGGVVAIQGTVVTLGTDSGSAGLTTVTCTITANDTDDCIKVEVNGVAATNLRYSAYLVSTETLYA